MIVWDGKDIHDRNGCWGDRNGRECGEPATIVGLCASCYTRLGGQRPVMLHPAPASAAFETGCGQR